MEPKYPHVHIRLTGEDGNAFAILARSLRALREAGVSDAERAAFVQEATASDYDHLLATVMAWMDAD